MLGMPIVVVFLYWNKCARFRCQHLTNMHPLEDVLCYILSDHERVFLCFCLRNSSKNALERFYAIYIYTGSVTVLCAVITKKKIHSASGSPMLLLNVVQRNQPAYRSARSISITLGPLFIPVYKAASSLSWQSGYKNSTDHIQTVTNAWNSIELKLC